jgi:hypothetical protein
VERIEVSAGRRQAERKSNDNAEAQSAQRLAEKSKMTGALTRWLSQVSAGAGRDKKRFLASLGMTRWKPSYSAEGLAPGRRLFS